MHVQTAYCAPESLQEVLNLIHESYGKCQVLAGGTDLVVDLNERRGRTPENIVYLGNIAEMRRITLRESVCEIGSLVTHGQLEKHPAILHHLPLLAEAAKTVGAPAIRQMGTIGGNVARSSPAGDMATALLAFDPLVNAVSVRGMSQYRQSEFHIGPKKTQLKPDEVIYSLSVSLPEKPWSGHAYTKLGKRKALSIAIVSCAVLVAMDSHGKRIAEARISLGSVAEKPIRAYEAEEYLQGQLPVEESCLRAGQIAQSICRPIDDIRASAGYRREMTRVFVARSLRQACSLALGKTVVYS